MRVLDLAFLYAVVGTGCAAAVLAGRGRRPLVAAVSDAVLVVALWPLYGPFLLLARAPRDGARPPDAAHRVEDGHLAPLLPTPEELATLGARVATARRRIEDIDALLATPDASLPAAELQHTALTEGGASEVSVTAAAMRVTNLRRLHRIRDRYARELEDAARLLNELERHAHVVRLAGEETGETGDLVRELALRVEGLDEMLDQELGDGPWRRS